MKYLWNCYFWHEIEFPVDISLYLCFCNLVFRFGSLIKRNIQPAKGHHMHWIEVHVNFDFISHSFIIIVIIGNIHRANHIRSYANQSDRSLGASAKFKTTWYCQAHWKFNRFHRNHIDSYCNDKKLNYLTNQYIFSLKSFWTPSSFLWIKQITFYVAFAFFFFVAVQNFIICFVVYFFCKICSEFGKIGFSQERSKS